MESGMRFGRLVVLSAGPKKGHSLTFICQCDCGQQRTVRKEHLLGGRQVSCGCWRDQNTIARSTIHGESAGGKPTPEFVAWCAAKDRCSNPNNAKFADYGGRGIAMCDEWRDDYPAFLAYVGRKPSPKHSLDRIDVGRGYEPGNVRWATAREQRINQRRVPPERATVLAKMLPRRDYPSYSAYLRAS